MRTLIITSWLLLVAPVLSFAAVSTNQIILFTQQMKDSGQKTQWRISESQLLALPEWKLGAKSIPLAPDKAWQIARAWYLKQGFSQPVLERMDIHPFNAPDLSQVGNSRFYYHIECHDLRHTKIETIVILLDGSVLEAHQL